MIYTTCVQINEIFNGKHFSHALILLYFVDEIIHIIVSIKKILKRNLQFVFAKVLFLLYKDPKML